MSATGVADEGDLVHLQVDNGVATITLDSPDNRNALSSRLRAELQRHLDSATNDDAVRVVVLTHTGPVFCSGADLREARQGDPERPSAELVQILRTLMESAKPVVARLAGPARAGGIGLVAAADFAVAVAEATFGFSEVRIGVVPSIISVPLRQRVADGVLQRLFLAGGTFDAVEAERIGLISTVSSSATLDKDVAAVVGQLRLGAPQALAAAKDLVRAPSEVHEQQFAAMRELSASFFSSAEAQEGLRAFAERRPPAWTVPEPTGELTGRPSSPARRISQ